MEKSKARNFVFTINNYTEEDVVILRDIGARLEKHHYVCFGLEIAPKTGTPHIQGYIQLNDSQRYSFVHKYFNLTHDGELVKFHLEPANGTAEENILYCKKDGEFFQYGTPTKQGERTDLAEIKRKIKENPRQLNKIIDEDVTNQQQLRFAQLLQPIYLFQRDKSSPPTCYWIFGSSGVGKTKLVYDTFTDVCAVSSYQWLGTGYVQQECLLFDDFREKNVPFETLLKITDRYPFMLFYKGGQVPLNSPFIVFTSPHSVEHTFTATGEDLKQIKRRLIQINLDTVENIGSVNLRNLDQKHVYRQGEYCEDVW